jgi:hypothetical protein
VADAQQEARLITACPGHARHVALERRRHALAQYVGKPLLELGDQARLPSCTAMSQLIAAD